MHSIFDKAQSSVSYKLLSKDLSNLFVDKTSFKEFLKDFIRFMKYALVRPREDRFANSVVSFCVDFVVGLEGNLSSTLQNQNQTANETLNSSAIVDSELERNAAFMKCIIQFLLKSSSAMSPNVRARSCEMIGRFLKEMSDDAEIDYDLSLEIEKSMLTRTRDKNSAVRAMAFFAMTRLQDPHNESCQVTKACLMHLALDPCAEVRLGILEMLEPSRPTLCNVIERCRDVNEVVRRAAYSFISSNVNLSALSMDQRIEILYHGFNDQSSKVQSFCANTLLNKWISKCNGNPVTFIKFLSLDEPLHVASKALNIFFKANDPENLINFVDFIDQQRKMQTEKMNGENVFYLKALCDYLISTRKLSEMLDTFLPDIPVICSAIKEFSQHDPGLDVDKCYERDFICEQLIELIGFHEFLDDCCKQLVSQFIREMLVPTTAISLVPGLMRHLPDAVPNMNRGIDMMLDLIANLTEPLDAVEKHLSEKEKHELDMKMGHLRLKLHRVRDSLEECVQIQDFRKAEELKNEIVQLEKERDKLNELYKPAMVDVQTQKTDSTTMEMCLTIVCEIYQCYKPKTLTPGLRMLIESLILNGIQCVDDENVKRVAIIALGHTCYLDKELATKYFMLLFQIIRMDQTEVRIAALKVVFDFFMIHNFDTVVDVNSSTETRNAMDISSPLSSSTSNSTSSESGISDKVINVLSTYLNSKDPEELLITAEGLAKLLLSQKISSSSVLSKLIILWFWPKTETNIQLRSMLGEFLPLYAATGRANQLRIMSAFIPTLRKICNSPPKSSLHAISLENLSKFFIHLTTNRALRNTESNDNCSVNVEMGAEMSNEILQRPDSEISWWLVKSLPTLELCGANDEQLHTLNRLIEKLEEDVGDIALKNAIAKYKANVQSALGEGKENRKRSSVESANCDQ